MNILVTAGNTRTMIDRVRCITNIFTGRTGANIAAEAARRGHVVTLLTSHPEVLPPTPGLTVRAYHTFEELAALMAEEIPGGKHDAVIHSAAVSDYHIAGVFAADPLARRASEGPTASEDDRKGMGSGELTLPLLEGLAPRPRVGLTDVSGGKVKSSHPEVWIRLTPAPKLVDKVRSEWGFRGVLVKFKLEVGVSEDELRQIAERSRVQSNADLMSANTLDQAGEWALVGAGEYTKVPRASLAAEIITRVEMLEPGMQ
jgi:phosphopantothenoylcysteine synthetase/decarboxylase